MYYTGNSDLTQRVLNHDHYFGRQVINFSVSSHLNSKWQAVSHYRYIIKNKDGMYGTVSGGNNNIACFVGWCTGLTGGCFNPINLDNYIWSKTNNAFIPKDFKFLINVHIVQNEFYYYTQDSNKEIIEFYTTKNCFDKISLWRKKNERN